MVGLGDAQAKASDWRSPAEYRRADRQTSESADGLTSRRGEERQDLRGMQLSLWHIILILAAGKGQPDGACARKLQRGQCLGFGLLFLDEWDWRWGGGVWGADIKLSGTRSFCAVKFVRQFVILYAHVMFKCQ